MKEIHDSVASRKDLFVPPQFVLIILFGVIAVLRLEGAISGQVIDTAFHQRRVIYSPQMNENRRLHSQEVRVSDLASSQATKTHTLFGPYSCGVE